MSSPRRKSIARKPSPKRRRAAAVLFMGGFGMRDVGRLLRIRYAQVQWALRKTLVLAWLLVLGAHPVSAQITIPNTFVNATPADATQVNANFAAVGSNALNRTGGTMTGTLTAQAIAPSTDALYALGDGTHRFTSLSLSGATNGGAAYGTGTALAFTAAGSSGQVLKSTGAGAPAWVDEGALWSTGDAYITTAASCRAGFTDVSAANNGFYIVIGNANINSTAGTALNTGALENRAAGVHGHGVTDPGHVHAQGGLPVFFNGGGGALPYVDVIGGIGPSANTSSATTGLTVNNSAGVAGTNAPYKIFRLCQK